jgi:hypothetical protein
VRTVGCFTDGHGRAAPVARPALKGTAESGVHPACPSGGRLMPPVDLRRMSVLVPCHGCLVLRSGENSPSPS